MMKHSQLLSFITIILVSLLLVPAIFTLFSSVVIKHLHKTSLSSYTADYLYTKNDFLKQVSAQQSNETLTSDQGETTSGRGEEDDDDTNDDDDDTDQIIDGETGTNNDHNERQLNQPPIAVANPSSELIESGDIITLSGTDSSDPDGDLLTYQWTQISGDPVELTDADTATASFQVFSVTDRTTLTLRLTVNDGKGGEAFDEVTVTGRPRIVEIVPGPGGTEEVQAVEQNGRSMELVVGYQWYQSGATFSCSENSVLDRNTDSRLELSVTDSNTGRTAPMKYRVEVTDFTGKILSKSGETEGSKAIIQYSPGSFSTGTCNAPSIHRTKVFIEQFDGETVNGSFELDENIRVVPELQLHTIPVLTGIPILVILIVLRNNRRQWGF